MSKIRNILENTFFKKNNHVGRSRCQNQQGTWNMWMTCLALVMVTSCCISSGTIGMYSSEFGMLYMYIHNLVFCLVGVSYWLVGVSYCLVGVSYWLVGVSYWLVGVSYWLVGVS